MMTASTFGNRKEELRERTKRFAGSVVDFFVGLDRREEVRILGRQLLRAGTSVAANYREASRARSPAEFISKIELCVQEADETQFWLELLRDHCNIDRSLIQRIWSESDELISIFIAMSKNTKRKAQEKPET